MFFITSQKKKEALKEIKTWKNCCSRVQDKGSGFVVISNDEYCKKVNTQIERSSFTQLPCDITKSFENKVNHFIVKWEDLRFLNKKLASYIKSNYCKPGTMYGLIKTHKENNSVRVYVYIYNIYIICVYNIYVYFYIIKVR